MSEDVELVDGEVVDGEGVVDAPVVAPGAKPLTAAQRRVMKVAASIQEEVSHAVLMGETVEALRKRLEWARQTRPAGMTVWRRASVLALTAAGMTQGEIAGLLTMSRSGVNAAQYEMRKRGVGIDGEARLDHDIVPRAIEQLSQKVDEGDKESILAVLRGRGALRQHVSGGEVGRGPMTVLAVKFEMPPGMQPSLVGTVVGKPREDT